MFIYNTFVLFGLVAISQAATTRNGKEPQSRKDILTEYYGEQHTWKSIKAIDVFPNATFDGKPVDDSIVWAYTLPAIGIENAKEMHSKLDSFDKKHGKQVPRDVTDDVLSKRWTCGFDTCECYETGTWVQQYQLQGGFGSATNEADGQIRSQGYYAQYKEWYQLPDGNWAHFTKSGSSELATVYYYAQPWLESRRYDFLWNEVWNGFWAIVNRCKGSNPDVAGGWDVGSYYYTRIDVVD